MQPYLKKRLWHSCEIYLAKFLTTPFFIDYLWATASESKEQ